MTVAPTTKPTAWKAEDLRRDESWIQRLTPEEIQGFRAGLAHLKTVDKPMLELTQADFPIPEASRDALDRAMAATAGRWGLCLVKGFPVDEWTEPECRLFNWGIGLYMGVARGQNKDSDLLGDVREAGGSYRSKGGRGYNTNVELDFHQDGNDVVTLLCRRTAKSGGRSKVISSIALYDKVKEVRPDLAPLMEDERAWWWSFQGTQSPEQPDFYRGPMVAYRDGFFCANANRKNSDGAQKDFTEVPRYTEKQKELLALLDVLMPSDELCFSMELERGDRTSSDT